MTQKEKDLLIKDLCSRLPYGVMVSGVYHFDICYSKYICEPLNAKMLDIKEWDKSRSSYDSHWYSDIKPYLRPLSSITEEEEFDYVANIKKEECFLNLPIQPRVPAIDWLLRNHFDFRNLIPLGLAFEASKGMYCKI